MADTTADEERGHHAERPSEIPKRGWWAILKRTYAESSNDHVSIVAAGVAFYGLLALFPAIAAVVSAAALFMDPATIESQISALAQTLPQDAASILTGQAQKVVQSQQTAGLAAIVGILLAIYSSSKGMSSLIEGMNIAYDETDDRGFVMQYVVRLGLTGLLVFGFLLAVGIAIVAPATVAALQLPGWIESLVNYATWPVLALFTMFGLGAVYRWGPARDAPEVSWVSWGAVIATITWIVGSLAFSWYVRNFGSYGETYGALGGVIILLMWLWLSSYIILMGAELNSEMEHQTRYDTTTGGREPMGERDAVKADKVPGDQDKDDGI